MLIAIHTKTLVYNCYDYHKSRHQTASLSGSGGNKKESQVAAEGSG
jgi:hypothetical protein